jgi:uncharacterized spore protein YtfJ
MKIQGLVDSFSKTLYAGRAFGEPIERDGVTIIPVALVAGGGGGGGGSGPVPHAESSKKNGSPMGSSSGGGFGGVSFPLGVYAVSGDKVRWVPALDATRVAIAALGIIKLALRLRAAGRRTRGHRHAHPH